MAQLCNCFVLLQFVARMDATISEVSPDTACTGQAVNAVAVSKASVNSDGTVRISVSATVVSEAVVSATSVYYSFLIIWSIREARAL